MSDYDTFYLWRIEQSHNSYLMWMASWLVGAIGASSIILELSTSSNLEYNGFIVLFIMFIGIIFGMSFCMWRLRNIAKEQVLWMNKVDDKKKKRDLFMYRGRFIQLFVNDKGIPNKEFLLAFILFQNIILSSLFFSMINENIIFLIIMVYEITFFIMEYS